MTGNGIRKADGGRGADRSIWKRDASVWVGLLFLLLGLALMDRSFATWRNHSSNLHDATGRHTLPNPTTGPLPHPVRVAYAGSAGLAMLVISVGLLGRRRAL